ncbi:MAG: FadD3 family acyl-CoA ligase [Acidimicrobiia bacterium]
MDWQTIPELVAWGAHRFGDRPAIEDGDVTVSYAELAERTRTVAAAALAHGLEPGDRAAIWAPNRHEWVVAACGLLSAGATLVPLNTRFKGAEAAYALRKTRTRLLVTIGEFLGTDYAAMLAGQDVPLLETVVRLRTPDWPEFLAAGASVPAGTVDERVSGVRPDDPSDIIFTSGTTGRPKGAIATHAQTLRVFDVWSDIVGLVEDDRYLVVNPFFHTFGYKAGIIACLTRGATLLPQQVFDVDETLRRIEEQRITVLPGPPTLYQSLLSHPARREHDLSSLRLAVTGAAVVPVVLIERMHAELSLETVLTAYGLTEATGTVTMCRRGDDAKTVATTSGRAIPDVEVRVVDASGAEVPRGEPGEVVVRGYNVMQGYFEEPDETAKAFDADGWLHTGDVGVMDEQGNLRITDRIKDMYVVGGFNAYPAEIEQALARYDGVSEVAVIGVPDERLGEVGKAFVIPKPGSAPAPEEVIAWCRQELANYKVPRYVEIVDALPRNPIGKVLKYELRQRHAST